MKLNKNCSVECSEYLYFDDIFLKILRIEKKFYFYHHLYEIIANSVSFVHTFIFELYVRPCRRVFTDISDDK